VEHLVRALEMPLGFPDRPVRDPVWHCTLRNADGDRALSDAEWGQVAADVLHRTGLAATGQDGGCPWLAVRHDEVSIHLVAMLAQEAGRPERLWNDFLRLREGCLAAERRYGLTVTAPADRTAATHTTRGEREKAARAGQGEAPRDWLRRQVRLAAVAAGSDTEFLDRLRAVGVAVKERRGQAGELTGYAVARPDPASGRRCSTAAPAGRGPVAAYSLEVRRPAPGDVGGDAMLRGVSEKSPHNGVWDSNGPHAFTGWSRDRYGADFSYRLRCGVGIRAGVDGQAGPGAADRGVDGGRDRPRADLPG